MEKNGRITRAACANLSQMCNFLVVHALKKNVFAFLCSIFDFCTILSIFCTYFVCKTFRLKILPVLFWKLFPSLLPLPPHLSWLRLPPSLRLIQEGEDKPDHTTDTFLLPPFLTSQSVGLIVWMNGRLCYFAVWSVAFPKEIHDIFFKSIFNCKIN